MRDFSLTTIRRAKEREEFDKKMKEKEEEKEYRKKEVRTEKELYILIIKTIIFLNN